MQDYYGMKRVSAEPTEKDGQDGYKVVYAGGYESWSPKKAFEDAYHHVEALDFSGALVALRQGFRLTRQGWNGPDQWIQLQVPDRYGKITLPYLYIHTVKGDLVPWMASQTDLLSDDWAIVEE